MYVCHVLVSAFIPSWHKCSNIFLKLHLSSWAQDLHNHANCGFQCRDVDSQVQGPWERGARMGCSWERGSLWWWCYILDRNMSNLIHPQGFTSYLSPSQMEVPDLRTGFPMDKTPCTQWYPAVWNTCCAWCACIIARFFH